MEQEEKPLRKFAALARKKGTKDPFITCVIYEVDKPAATRWFGENNYEIDGEVYARGK